MNLSGSTVDVTISGLDDGTCTLCDDVNGLYADVPYVDSVGSCSWSSADAEDPPTRPYVVVGVTHCGSGDYVVWVSLELAGSGGGCTGDEQTIVFRKNLGSTKPACLADMNGSVPWHDATNPEGFLGVSDVCSVGTGYEDPDAGCTVGSVTCSITFSA